MIFLPFVLAFAAILGVAGVVAVAFWNDVLKWAEESLFPWVNEHFPTLEEPLRTAFVHLDTAAVTLRRLARRAWEVVRSFLLKQVIVFSKTVSNEWVRKVTSYLVRTLESGEEQPYKRETEVPVSHEELPADVREAFLRRGEKSKEINVTELREQELLQMESAS